MAFSNAVFSALIRALIKMDKNGNADTVNALFDEFQLISIFVSICVSNLTPFKILHHR